MSLLRARECGNYDAAEPYGRTAVELDPGDMCGHARGGDVIEMQGRARDGNRLARRLQRHGDRATTCGITCGWHRALYHYEQREFDEVLALYDKHSAISRRRSPGAAGPSSSTLQNASSMLFRLERRASTSATAGREIADKAEQRIGDCLSAFTLPHWMMALAATAASRPRRVGSTAARVRLGQGHHRAGGVKIALPLSRRCWRNGRASSGGRST